MIDWNSYAGGRALTARLRIATRCWGQRGFARQAGAGGIDISEAGVG